MPVISLYKMVRLEIFRWQPSLRAELIRLSGLLTDSTVFRLSTLSNHLLLRVVFEGFREGVTAQKVLQVHDVHSPRLKENIPGSFSTPISSTLSSTLSSIDLVHVEWIFFFNWKKQKKTKKKSIDVVLVHWKRQEDFFMKEKMVLENESVGMFFSVE